MQRVNDLQARGAKVQLLDTRTAVVTETSINHWVHALITLLSCGLWLIVWVIHAIDAKPRSRIITADDPPLPPLGSFWERFLDQWKISRPG